MTPEELKGIAPEAIAERAAAALRTAAAGYQRWVRSVRPADGAPGRFRWAVETTRGPNVAATSYILNTLRAMGAFDAAITDTDRTAGVAWIRSLHGGNEQYRDPAICDRPSPGWPAGKPWPEPATQEGVNQYARGALRVFLGIGAEGLPDNVPPPGFPQPGDDPASMLEWIRTRPWDQNVWGAGSHGMRMARYMLTWHRRGLMPVEPVHEAFRFFYSIQDPETGLWGTPNQPKNVRINGTFKLFVLMRDQLDLPLPHAAKIIDQVLSEFYRPDYDEHVGGCDEWDNWYVIGLALGPSGGHRAEEIRKMAAWRLLRVLALFQKPDGGLSYSPSLCATHWNSVDMAPSLPQGDAVGAATLVGGLNVCIDLAGIAGAVGWPGTWRMHPGDPEGTKLVAAGLRFRQ